MLHCSPDLCPIGVEAAEDWGSSIGFLKQAPFVARRTSSGAGPIVGAVASVAVLRQG